MTNKVKNPLSFKQAVAAYAVVKATYEAEYKAAYAATPTFTTGGQEYWSYDPERHAKQKAYWAAVEVAEGVFALGLRGCGPLEGPTLAEALETTVTRAWYAKVRKTLVRARRKNGTLMQRELREEYDPEGYTPDPRRMALTKRRTRRLKKMEAWKRLEAARWQSYQARKALHGRVRAVGQQAETMVIDEKQAPWYDFVEEANAQA